MLLDIQNASVYLSGEAILSHFNFKVTDKEKIGIVGRNGSGKTTLLKVIEGEIDLDKNDDETIGTISKSGIKNIGYLSQITFSDLTNTVEKELDDAYNDGHKNEVIEEWERDKAKNLSFLKFGFKPYEFSKKISEFSGGEKTKIALIKLLLSNPDLLILDEPTNHLDIEAIEWLSDFLKNYKKTLIVVSHDRQFLNDVCNVIYEVENRALTRYVGNYDSYVDKKAVDYETKLKEYEKASAEVKKLHGLYERFRYKPSKAKFAQSRLKMANRIENKMGNKPLQSSTESFRSNFTPKRIGGNDVLEVSNLSVGYSLQDNKLNLIQKNMNFKLQRGERLGVIGRNGSGKSTLLKTIVAKLPKISGEIKYGHEIDYVYFDQDIAKNDSACTVFDDFHNAYPHLTNTEVRTKLGNFLFEGDDVFKEVRVLSGGEKVRLCLAKLFETRPNLLILDEPTNHLDILGKESLENILDEYEGSIIFVSHDRYFVKRVASKIIDFSKSSEIIDLNNNDDENDGQINNKKNIEVDLYEKDFVSGMIKPNDTNKEIIDFDDEDNNISVNKLSFEEQKEKRRNENLSKKIEEKISSIETNIKEKEQLLDDENIQKNFEKLFELTNEVDNLKNELQNLYNEWENLNI